MEFLWENTSEKTIKGMVSTFKFLYLFNINNLETKAVEMLGLELHIIFTLIFLTVCIFGINSISTKELMFQVFKKFLYFEYLQFIFV